LPVGHFFGEAYQGVDLLHLVHVTAIGDAFPDPLQLVRGSSQCFGDRRLLGHACISCISTHETSKRSGSKPFYGKRRRSIDPLLIQVKPRHPLRKFERPSGLRWGGPLGLTSEPWGVLAWLALYELNLMQSKHANEVRGGNSSV
jgi:hypothetical protein